ncbi:hypothetical protein ADU60_16210 (plasmid) [Vibrio coralliilyticus]|nr:hypothetical protein DVV14_26200 [Vibrio coralliilyticus]KPH25029.1 hypothetical protein ADU60_16210 [Vibrio coralliilyticus]
MTDVFIHIHKLASLWVFIWILPFMFYSYRYCFGDQRYIDELIGNLSKEPETFKAKWYLNTSGLGAGGLFVMYAFLYPLLRHRAKKRTMKFDVFMWANFAFLLSFVI